MKTALDDASTACASWREQPSAECGEALAESLDQLNSVSQHHLDDEEQDVVPLAAVTLEAVAGIATRFGSDFLYLNRNGRPAISKAVLEEFRSLSQYAVVWDRTTFCWELRAN